MFTFLLILLHPKLWNDILFTGGLISINLLFWYQIALVPDRVSPTVWKLTLTVEEVDIFQLIY